MEKNNIKPTIERPHPITKEGGTGTQRIYKFKNGYGASVVRFKLNPILTSMRYGSYTDNDDEWELAVVHFNDLTSDDDFELVYDTPITSDVIGHLKEKEVQTTLHKIQRLPKRKN